MSEVAIFIIGAVIFAITVDGTVMAGGIALGRAAERDDEVGPESQPTPDRSAEVVR